MRGMNVPRTNRTPRLWAAGFVLSVCACLWTVVTPAAAATSLERPTYHSPFLLAYSPDGSRLAVSDSTGGSLFLLDRSTGRVVREIKLGGRPAGVAWSADGRFLYTSDTLGRQIVRIDTSGKSRRRLAAGRRPVGLALARERGLLLAANSAGGSVSLLDASGRRPRRDKPAGHTPYLLAVTPDERLAVVGNRLPRGEASDARVSATVTLVDLEVDRPPTQIPLPPNSVNTSQIAVSPDGRWAYVVHNLARARLPTEQIEYGWINANAMTVLDLAGRRRRATILLDRFNDGAADPFGAAVSPDGATLWITLSGTHQLGRIDLTRLLALAPETPVDEISTAAPGEAEDGPPNVLRGSMVYSDTWRLGVEDPHSVELVQSDLPAEYGHGHYLGNIFFRTDLPGKGPRGLAVSPDGRQIAVAMYYSGTVVLIDAATREVVASVSLGPQPPEDDARRGESIFHDAEYCFQRWLSCATCHPDGRADGLNWDLMNDGIGNPKNTRSLVWAHQTPPMMSRGVRADMSSAVAAGFKFFLFKEAAAEDLRAVEAYLASMAPEESPRLVNGRLSEKARRGKAIFEDPKVGCSRCHPAPLYTDLGMHDVGTLERPRESARFDTPSLVELWRTGPYLHHGRAVTLGQVLTTRNPGDRHGRTSRLADEELDELVEYLWSL